MWLIILDLLHQSLEHFELSPFAFLLIIVHISLIIHRSRVLNSKLVSDGVLEHSLQLELILFSQELESDMWIHSKWSTLIAYQLMMLDQAIWFLTTLNTFSMGLYYGVYGGRVTAVMPLSFRTCITCSVRWIQALSRMKISFFQYWNQPLPSFYLSLSTNAIKNNTISHAPLVPYRSSEYSKP